MSSTVLKIAKAKIARANDQISNFNATANSFISTNSYEIISDLSLDQTERIWRFKLSNKDTTILSVLIGEIGHNLRSSLDNLVCEIARAHAGRCDRTYFPFGKSAQIFNAELIGKTKHLPADAIAMIQELKPYRGGNKLLWAIHELNRDDKHPGVDAITNVQGFLMESLIVECGDVLIVGNRHGQHLVTEHYKPKFFAVEARHEDGEFLTTTPIAKFQFKGNPTFEIAFCDIDGFEGISVVDVLDQMRELTESIFISFEQRFFR